MTLLYFGHLSAQKPLFHAVTTRSGGVSEPPYDALNLAAHVGDDPALVRANRRLIAKALGTEPDRMVFMDQVHGNRVVLIDQPPDQPPACDAMITATPGVSLGVMVADCVPLLFYDPQNCAIGVAHAGWKGTFAQIAANTIEAMQDAFGSRPERLLAGIGPGIGGTCYEVDERVAQPWLEKLPKTFHPPLRESAKGRWLLDLQEANRLMLIEAGVKKENIETMGLCSHCETTLFSYRREQKTGRFAGLIGLR